MTPPGSEPENDVSGDDYDPLDFKTPNKEAMKRFEREMAEAEDRQKRGRTAGRPRADGRTTPIAVRFDEFTIKRLRALAERRKTGYQTLLKQFVVERLYEEERREGIID